MPTTQDIERLVVICSGKDCAKRGSKDIQRALKKCAKEQGCKKSTLFMRTKCAGLCKQAPVVSFQPANTWVTRATAQMAVTAFKAVHS